MLGRAINGWPMRYDVYAKFGRIGHFQTRLSFGFPSAAFSLFSWVCSSFHGASIPWSTRTQTRIRDATALFYTISSIILIALLGVKQDLSKLTVTNSEAWNLLVVAALYSLHGRWAWDYSETFPRPAIFGNAGRKSEGDISWTQRE